MVALGKMGIEVISLINQNSNLQLIGGFDKTVSLDLSYPVYINTNDIIEKPDVIIDFSVPEATLVLLPFCVKNNIPIVIATTGFTKQQQAQIVASSSHIPIFQSANMCYGIALVNKIVSMLSKELKNSEIEIIETHHSQKKDAPSRYCSYVSGQYQYCK